MHLRFGKHVVVGAAVAIAAVVLVFFGTQAFLDTAVHRMVLANAADTGKTWARFFAESVPAIEEVANGRALTRQEADFVHRAQAAGDVFRFKLFDAKGRLRLVSDNHNSYDYTDLKKVGSSESAVAAMTGDRVIAFVKEGHGEANRPIVYAETYQPLVKDGKVVGAVEVYVDQTRKQRLLKSELTLTSLVLAVLSSLFLMVPAVWAFKRSNDKALADRHIGYLATHDALTGLLNRTSFRALTTERIAGIATLGPDFAVLHLDIDRFQVANDELGHEAADELIRIFAERLKALSPESEATARIGSDEFAMLIDLTSEVDDIEEFIAAVTRGLGEPYDIGGRTYTVTISCGYALARGHVGTPEQLLACADSALQVAKTEGAGLLRRYDARIAQRLAERRELEEVLRSAVANQALDLYFQPQFATATRNLTGFEALLRLRNPAAGFIPPDVFISLAEDLGLIEDIGAWALRHAMLIAAAWPDTLSVAVNLSPRQFDSGKLTGIVRDALQASGLAPSRLELEITENLVIQDTDDVLAQLDQIKSLGVRIAMDDFGTGYSSLGYLWRFQFDKIKIDRSFMVAYDKSQATANNILQTIIKLGHIMNMSVVAEGVERQEQLEMLQTLGCDQVQGFLCGRPMPITELAGFLLEVGVTALDLPVAPARKTVKASA